ncbi:MAG: VOC family protein, partial [Pseudomonadota bacterium]|nr:VOC family protein [Pseudomonadota bacterium]
MAERNDNPMGTDGFEFVEYTAPDPEQLRGLFVRMGFPVTARHRSKNVTLHRQGDINFVINAEPGGFGQRFAREHGPSACAMAFRVRDAAAAFRRAVERGAKPVELPVGPMELHIPAIEGIGGSLIYLVDRYGDRTIYDVDFVQVEDPAGVRAAGLALIDHLTHNVSRGHMDLWSGFYERLFNFREIRYFDIEGKKTGLFSRAMTSPCGKIRIPINESQDDKSQIEEYLREYHGEGIQHIALFTDDIYATVDALRANGV